MGFTFVPASSDEAGSWSVVVGVAGSIGVVGFSSVFGVVGGAGVTVVGAVTPEVPSDT